MSPRKSPKTHLPGPLKELVHLSVSLLGEVLQQEVGPKLFRRIEATRRSMAGLRKATTDEKFKTLQKLSKDLGRLSPDEQRRFARGFTLMLQLINACENAYRTNRLESHPLPKTVGEGPDLIAYVLTAHPTEARSPANIAAFHEIQKTLVRLLKSAGQAPGLPPLSKEDREDLIHGLELAWRTKITRDRQPQVKDEAEHVYSMLLRDEILLCLLRMGRGETAVSLRTWVGGDKDGHPGVDEKVMRQSLTLSRNRLVRLAQAKIHELRREMATVQNQPLMRNLRAFEKCLTSMRVPRPGDGARASRLQDRFLALDRAYLNAMHARHPALRDLESLLAAFPALVVPLELREASDVLMSHPKHSLAINRMLQLLARLSRGGEPRWYARGFIISMTESIDHIRRAALFQKRALGRIALPVIPLFEQTESLAHAEKIVRQMLQDRELRGAAIRYWNRQIELMVGYSDSAKEGGVLESRLFISQALPKLEKVCQAAGFTPIFFHGSGGSIDRGGGSIEDQTAWWPNSALRNYKVTVQGEMIERGFASSAIAEGQFEHIRQSVAWGLHHSRKMPRNPDLRAFAEKVSQAYREKIHDEDFLKAVSAATLYSDLSFLKIGSRPVKRSATLTVAGLRAIPWVMCWTQSRVLFPTWWGVGRAWAETSAREKRALKKAFRDHALFRSYVKALGFTLAKIELAIWRLHLSQSSLEPGQADRLYREFQQENRRTWRFFREVTGQRNPLWFKPWLGESILLRSSMIHPLNVLQIAAEKRKDALLLRTTVAGISSGMLTTG